MVQIPGSTIKITTHHIIENGKTYREGAILDLAVSGQRKEDLVRNGQAEWFADRNLVEATKVDE